MAVSRQVKLEVHGHLRWKFIDMQFRMPRIPKSRKYLEGHFLLNLARFQSRNPCVAVEPRGRIAPVSRTHTAHGRLTYSRTSSVGVYGSVPGSRACHGGCRRPPCSGFGAGSMRQGAWTWSSFPAVWSPVLAGIRSSSHVAKSVGARLLCYPPGYRCLARNCSTGLPSCYCRRKLAHFPISWKTHSIATAPPCEHCTGGCIQC